MIEEAKLVASSRYETAFPMTGIIYGSCGGSIPFCGFGAFLLIQPNGRDLASSKLESIMTMTNLIIHSCEGRNGGRLSSGKELFLDSLQ